MITKPPHGDPCNGCGVCCQAEPCTIGGSFFDQKVGECPALEWTGDRFICGLAAHPADYNPVACAISGEKALSQAVSLLTGEGIGCDSQRHDEEFNPALGERMRAWAKRYGHLVPLALELWGIEST